MGLQGSKMEKALQMGKFSATGRAGALRPHKSEFSEQEKNYVAQSNLSNRLIAFYGILGRLECRRVLDVGCGPGFIGACFLKDYGCEVHGIDKNEADLELAQEKGLIVRKVDVEKEDFPYPSEFFDVALFNEVIDHIIKYDHCLNEIYRVLEKKGVLVISASNLYSAPNILQMIVHGRRSFFLSQTRNRGHVSFFSTGSLKVLLSAHCFKVDEIDYVNYSPSTVLGLILHLVCFLFPRLGLSILVKACKS